MMANSNVFENDDREMMSVYGSYKLSDRFTLFGRYDDYTSEGSWDEDGTYVAAGVENQLTKGVKSGCKY